MLSIDYYKETKDYWLTNLFEQLKTPILLRVDLNIPLDDGKIMEDSPRIDVYANIISIMSEYAGLVVITHQGRPGRKDFISLRQHKRALERKLGIDKSIEFVEYEDFFSEKTKRRIMNLEENEILLYDNIRFLDEEFTFDPYSSKMIKFFKGIINTTVNDAMPTWHRANTSLMSLPYISENVYVGLRSVYELEILSKTKEHFENGNVGIVIGGAKVDKVKKYLPELAKCSEIFTGGIPGQIVAKINGYDLGKENEYFISTHVDKTIFELFREIVKKYKIHYPVDFVVSEAGEDKIYRIEDLWRSRDGVIMDIGPETVELYAEELQSKEIRIKGGPLGVYEKGYNNGSELVKRIAGYGLIFLGGDTASELVKNDLYSVIESVGGKICLSGGAFLHGLVGKRYPSIDEILKLKK